MTDIFGGIAAAWVYAIKTAVTANNEQLRSFLAGAVVQKSSLMNCRGHQEAGYHFSVCVALVRYDGATSGGVSWRKKTYPD